MDITTIAVIALLGTLAYKVKALDGKGVSAAVLIGTTTIVFGGVFPFLALLTFVLLGVLATKYRLAEKIKKGIAQEGKGIRSWQNVLGNGLATVIFLLIEYYTKQDVFWAATFSSIATANADTLASELGKVFGKVPRMITTLKPAEVGENGAVSWQGEIIALIGAFIISIFAVFLTTQKVEMLLAVTLGGFIGCNIDSLIGATLENRGIVNNHHTNFLATLLGGIIGGAIFLSLL
ncbi:TIGR00297 family protein [Thermococcus aggregans]|uniref:TIGR00297 family protein n=1 Tax=Thermococcus aggregans TaxID=110163 RepID=A0A9E7MYS5_THEAG|nr:TIGR00297 family protein [Thermococcus aggregans]USS41314.1 TIGR00297 family protein [Thermococcus aggregans]